MKERVRAVLRLALAAFFVAVGVGHFREFAFFREIVPDWLPYPDAAVYVSGVAEILGGIGVLIPATRRAAGWGLLALLVAVYPANIEMAIHPEPLQHAPEWMGNEFTQAQRWARLPVQFLFMVWVWWTTLAAPRAKPKRFPGESIA